MSAYVNKIKGKGSCINLVVQQIEIIAEEAWYV